MSSAPFNRTFWYWKGLWLKLEPLDDCLQSHLLVLKAALPQKVKNADGCLQSHLLVLKLGQYSKKFAGVAAFNRTFWYWNNRVRCKMASYFNLQSHLFGIESLPTPSLWAMVSVLNRTFWYWSTSIISWFRFFFCEITKRILFLWVVKKVVKNKEYSNKELGWS